MSLSGSSQQVLWPLPETIPRQKAYTYLFLLCLTSLLIYFYSYPLSTENWAYIKQAIVHDSDSYHQYELNNSNINEQYYNLPTDDSKKPTDFSILKKLFLRVNKSILKDTLLKSTEVTASETSVPVTKSNGPSVESTGKSPTESKKSAEGQTNSVPTAAGDKLKPTNEAQNDLATRTNVAKATEEHSTTTFGEIETKEESEEQSTTILSDIVEETTYEISPITTRKERYMVEISTEISTMEEHVTKSTQSVHSLSSSTSKHAKSSNSTQQIDFTAISETNSEGRAQELSTTTTDAQVKDASIVQLIKDASPETTVRKTEKPSSNVQAGYLVFSEHCRIPDIDPMHPSIAHLIKRTPPLDCSEDYEALTWTAGNVLFLNQSRVLELTAGTNYTCCYRSVFRDKEGQSDNSVGFGKKCINISHETTITEEFIAVECKYGNGTTFQKEFHSFIFDKPKVEKRCNKAQKTSQYSVLIIGVDAVSRLNMHRQLNATAKYLINEMGATEIYGFNKVGDNTFPNLIPLMVGYDERELPSVCWKSDNLPLDRCNFMWKKFAKKGYRTLYAEDSPHISSFNYAKRGFYLQPTDYYYRHFILAYEDALGRDKPLNCYLCVGSTSETEAVLHWTEQFASHFANRSYFSFSWINSITHDFLNMGSSADRMYEIFFRTLHRTGALNKTIVILMGDHGMRWGAIRNTYVGRMEERLPMLLITLPQQFKLDYPEFAETLKQNSRRLVTPFDLHATLEHLLDLRKDWSLTNTDNVNDDLSKNFTSRALSLFQPIPEDRSCDDAYIEEHWCTCESSLEVDIQSNAVQQVAKFILDDINNLLKPVSDKCALLKLNSISDARLWEPPAEHKGHSAVDRIYTVVIHTSPSEAVFEGTVKITEGKTGSELLGTISRLNLYGNQSSCIDNAILKKYCYCL